MTKQQNIPIAPRIPRTALIVEDEANQRQMLTRALSEMEFQVTAAGSGELALKQMESFTPTLALLDLNLPGIGGLDLAKIIHKKLPHTRLIVLTGYGDLDAARRAMRLDVVDFLIKPCPLGELETAVSRAFQKAAEAHRLTESPSPTSEIEPPTKSSDAKTIDDVERQLISEALARHHGNRDEVAKELGISVRTLYYRLSRYQAQDRMPRKRN